MSFSRRVNDIVLKAIEDHGEDPEAISEEAGDLVKYVWQLGLVILFRH
jgi:hypothetical protein